MLKPKAILITGNSFRHKYIATCLSQSLDLSLVISEKKFNYVEAFKHSDAASVVESHFQNRDKAEEQYFGSYEFPEKLLEIEKGDVNKAKTIAKIDEVSPDVIVLFGSSIIGKTILTTYKQRVINMHLGLSPYYRGSGTNFWPIVDARPECVGVTFHIAELKVDAGPILHQIRVPNIAPDDSIHDMGNKVILESGLIYPKVIDGYLKGEILGEIQKGLENSDFKRLDLNKTAIEQTYRNVDLGLFKTYLLNKHKRDVIYPIVECENLI